ncbi:MAG: type IV pilus biogenesis/stability protein PilW [Nitrosomonadales bacterium]|nr:type IV pilus biogenesis/stability protein PilW [Nitrosomonadales bacterium]
MRLLAGAVILLMLGVAGCATQPTNSSGQTVAVARAKIHTELAAQYYERAQLGVAMEEIGKALQSEPDYAPAYNVRGLINMALREDRQAEEDFRRSLHLDGADSDAHNNFGWFLCQRGKVQESIKQFMTALKNPLYATPEKSYLNAGVCSGKSGNAKDAEEFLQKALILRPNMPEALLGLSELSFAGGDLAGAKSYFMRFDKNRETPLSAENLWLAVRIERKIGDRNSEESYALQLRKRFPDSRETQLMLQRQ